MGKGSLAASTLPILAALLVSVGLALEFYGLGSPTPLVLNGGGVVALAVWAFMHERHHKSIEERLESIEERLMRIEDLLLKKP